jgi:hypothetical protein
LTRIRVEATSPIKRLEPVIWAMSRWNRESSRRKFSGEAVELST